MAENGKREQIRFTTPKGTAIFPSLDRPSEKYNKFECKLRLDPEDESLKAFIAKAEAIRDAFYEETRKDLVAKKKHADVKELKKVDIVTVEYNDEGEETGFVLLKASADAVGKRKDGSTFERVIPIFDASNKKLDKVPRIFGGSELKVAFVAFPYYMASAKSVGMSLRLEAAQLLKLVSAGGASAERFGFGQEDGGYEAPEQEESSDFADEGSPSGKPSAAADDF